MGSLWRMRRSFAASWASSAAWPRCTPPTTTAKGPRHQERFGRTSSAPALKAGESVCMSWGCLKAGGSAGALWRGGNVLTCTQHEMCFSKGCFLSLSKDSAPCPPQPGGLCIQTGQWVPRRRPQEGCGSQLQPGRRGECRPRCLLAAFVHRHLLSPTPLLVRLSSLATCWTLPRLECSSASLVPTQI